MELLRVALCDDQPAERDKLLLLLKQSPVRTECALFAGGEELLEAYRPGAFDLLLIDIYMKGMTGVETVRKIRERDGEVPIAFTTSSTEHALEGYRLSVLKYLEKPVRQQEMDHLLRIVALHRARAPRLAVSRNGVRQEIALTDLLYLEQRAHHVYLFMKDQTVMPVYAKLGDLFPQLEAQSFFQCHKSYCVNLRYVKRIDAEIQCYVMTDEKNIPISRSNRAGAKKAYEDFLFARARRNA